MPLTPIIQLVPLLQTRQDTGLCTNYLLALRASGELALIHIPWEASRFESFAGPSGDLTVQIKPVTLDDVNWTD